MVDPHGRFERARADFHRYVPAGLSGHGIGLSLAQIFYGPLADRYGRKPPLIAGLTLYMLASLGCAWASDVESLTLWRVAQAVGGACGIVIPRAVVRDHYDTQEAARALSILFFMAAGAAVLLAVVAWRLPESLPASRATPLAWRTISGNYGALLKHRRFMLYSLAGGLGSAGMFAYIAGSPRLFIEYFGVSPQHYGWFFGANAMALIAGSQVSARLLRRHPAQALLPLAQHCVAAAALVLLALTLAGVASLPLLMAGLLVFMASLGVINPNAAALALAEQGQRLGVASALLGTLQLGCGALAGFAVSSLPMPGALPLALVLALCATLSWLAGVGARRPGAI